MSSKFSRVPRSVLRRCKLKFGINVQVLKENDNLQTFDHEELENHEVMEHVTNNNINITAEMNLAQLNIQEADYDEHDTQFNTT